MPASDPPLDRSQVDRTAELMSRARRLLAYGGFDGIVTRPLHYDDEGVFPQFVASAQGCLIVDTTGQRYVDWVNGWGPVLLGYRHPAVETAIQAQMYAGPTVSMMHPIEVEVAEMLSRMVPCAEMVAFGKNGSDVLNAAVRIARAVTGREAVLQYGMHGFHDWSIVKHEQVRGIPRCLREIVHAFPYNDLDALEAAFRAHDGRIAAIVMEPVKEVLPEPGYLGGVQAIARRHGAVLVFDEVMTALRLGPGGAQSLYGVTPDLACLGKAMANGMPLSALVGKRELMQHLPSVGFGMTFRGETLSLAAAKAVLGIVQREPVAERLAEIGETVRAGFREDCAQLGIAWDLVGPPARMSFLFGGGFGFAAEELRDLFLQECLKARVFTNGNMLPSYAHDDDALALTRAGLRRALEVVARTLREGEMRGLHPVGGFPYGPRAHAARGFVEEILVDANGAISMHGWTMLVDGAPDVIEIVRGDGAPVVVERFERKDLDAAFPHVRGASRAGWRISLPAPEGGASGLDDELLLIARREEREAFRCRIVRKRRASGLAAAEGPYWIGDGVLYV